MSMACIGQDIMPTEERGEIGNVKPAGFYTVKYPVIEGLYQWNRCHMIAYALTAENDNENQLFTGSRFLNIDGMLPFEIMVVNYINETDNHVLYRVTCCYKDSSDIIASGVLMEGYSVEDNGSGICFCVYCYNSQPGIHIDYSTGETEYTGENLETAIKMNYSSVILPEDDKESKNIEENEKDVNEYNPEKQDEDDSYQYVLNTNTMKIHLPTCDSVNDIQEHNKEYSDKNLDELVEEGYVPCKRCMQ